MSGNAHANRQRRKPSASHRANCPFCKMRPKEAKRNHLYRNTNGHRHNPARKRRQKRPVKRIATVIV